MLNRDDRRHSEPPHPSSVRTPAQRDCDRLLYSSGFRRLANVTQVVAADQGYVFHNRLTHALKVAQIGKRLAERLCAQNSAEKLREFGGLDPHVLEAAGLAHDLGHPPFGHLAEETLNRRVEQKLKDGFDGNAQSFRIITKLAIRSEDEEGLNLTRAVLNAVLKYPWPRGDTGKRAKKWGAYQSEKVDFDWARMGVECPERKTLEAEIMDFADDIAYSVYDIEDFYRAGKIPLHRLTNTANEPAREAEEFFEGVFARWERREIAVSDEKPYRAAFERISKFFPVVPYKGRRDERAYLRDMTSFFVGRYLEKIELQEPKNCDDSLVRVCDEHKIEIEMLKELTWQYVIENPALVTQQRGYKLAINSLFDTFLEAILENKLAVFPLAIRERLEVDHDEPVRIVADFIASMTEQQAIEMFQRFKGISFGSFLKGII